MNTVVNRTLPITIRKDSRIVLIQTDKPIYKPGETGIVFISKFDKPEGRNLFDSSVKGRAIVLTRDMTSAKGAVSVTIQVHHQTIASEIYRVV